MFPLRPGTQFKYRGKIVEGDTSEPHTVVFTVTDLTKMVNGVRTVVARDQDFLRGDLQEQELAFFAQDDRGNVWNFGEYPEEYKDGKFTGAPSTWVRGTSGAYGAATCWRSPASVLSTCQDGYRPSTSTMSPGSTASARRPACQVGATGRSW
jgi:hypothetical protein